MALFCNICARLGFQSSKHFSVFLFIRLISCCDYLLSNEYFLQEKIRTCYNKKPSKAPYRLIRGTALRYCWALVTKQGLLFPPGRRSVIPCKRRNFPLVLPIGIHKIKIIGAVSVRAENDVSSVRRPAGIFILALIFCQPFQSVPICIHRKYIQISVSY